MIFRLNQFLLLSSFSLFVGLFFSPAAWSVDIFAPQQFRDLALEMVSDLELHFGSLYVDGSLQIDLQVYRDLINRTELLPVQEALDNLYYETGEQGQRILVRETNLAAVNFFPNLERIRYAEPIWASLNKSAQRNRLKVMIHHEFVPYFLKSPDRAGRYSKKLEELYEKKDSWKTLRSGFYKAVTFEDKVSEVFSSFYWYYVKVDKSGKYLLLEMVENPEGDQWCLDCYVVAPLIIPIRDIENKVLPMSSNNIVLNSPTGALEGVPYLRRISNDSFLMSSEHSSDPKNFDSEIKGLGSEAKGMIFERVRTLREINWGKPKKLTTFAFAFTNSRDCDVEKAKMQKDLGHACQQLLAFPLTKAVAEHCSEQVAEIFDLSQVKLYSKYKCAIVGKGSLMTAEGFTPIQRSEFVATLNRWSAYRDATLTLLGEGLKSK